jgi:hypothetical protein
MRSNKLSIFIKLFIPVAIFIAYKIIYNPDSIKTEVAGIIISVFAALGFYAIYLALFKTGYFQWKRDWNKKLESKIDEMLSGKVPKKEEDKNINNLPKAGSN